MALAPNPSFCLVRLQAQPQARSCVALRASACFGRRRPAFPHARTSNRWDEAAAGGRLAVVASAASNDAYPADEYIHPRYPFSHQFNPVDERTVRQKALDELRKITPIKGVKIAATGALLWTLAECFLGTVVFNPSLWTYGSWLLIFWPWLAALGIGAGTGYLAYRKYKHRASEREEQLLLVGSLIWLILVPLGHFQGYVEGYPILLFGVYLAYSLFERIVRLRVYGKLETGPQDPDWAVPINVPTWVGFVGSVIAGHWLAAFEAPPLMLSWNFAWQSKVAAAMILAALVFKYFGTYFLLKYSKRVNSPNATVLFGPYRWVRHPIYGSSILLLTGFCMALRAYGSMALILAGCLFYYEQLTKKEEDLLIKNFGEAYASYRKDVPNKYVPFLY